MLRSAAVLLFLLSPGPALAAAPGKVASFNLCADQFVVALADPGQIAGLSAFASDPDLSVVAAAARRFPRLEQRTEATVALRPDLVLVGPNDRPAMRHVLAGLGLRVEEVALVSDIAAARAQVRHLAQSLGHPERGEALIGAIDAARERLRHTVAGRTRSALVVERGGYVAGGGSLIVNLLREAGFVPPAGAPAGLGGFVALERLLMLRPDVLVTHGGDGAAGDQGALLLAHPALARLYPPARRLVVPRWLGLCGGPAIVAALDYLTGVAARRSRAGAEQLTPEPPAPAATRR